MTCIRLLLASDLFRHLSGTSIEKQNKIKRSRDVWLKVQHRSVFSSKVRNRTVSAGPFHIEKATLCFLNSRLKVGNLWEFGVEVWASELGHLARGAVTGCVAWNLLKTTQRS